MRSIFQCLLVLELVLLCNCLDGFDKGLRKLSMQFARKELSISLTAGSGNDGLIVGLVKIHNH